MFDLNNLFTLVKRNEIGKARELIKIKDDKITDSQFIDYIISLEKFIKLFVSGRQPEAFQYVSNIDQLLSFSNDDGLKYFLNTLLNFSEGLRRLLAGDVWKAESLLDIGSKDMERMSFFVPEFKKFGLNYKAVAKIATVRIYLNAGDIETAKRVSGEVNDIYDELLKTLDANIESDLSGFAEVFAAKLELSNLFTSLDYILYDLESMKNRLDNATVYKRELEKYKSQLKDGPIKLLIMASINIHSIFLEFYKLTRKILVLREPFDKSDIKELSEIQKTLFDTKELTINAGLRGQGYLYMVNQLIAIRNNLYSLGKISKKDFGRFSGMISGIAFLIFLIIVQLFIQPSAQLQFVYIFSVLILSLIVGFGYGALKFQPLLKLLSKNNSS